VDHQRRREDVASIVFEAVDGAITFVANIAGAMLKAIVNTVEDALNAMTALFKWIGAKVDAVSRWLGFLFDWSDFVAVKVVLKGAIKDGLKSFDGILDRVQVSGDAWFKHARDDNMPRLTSMPMAKPRNDQTMQTAWSAAQPPPSPLGADNVDIRTYAQLGWLKDRVSSPATYLSTGADKSAAINGSDPLAPLITAIETLMSDMGKAFTQCSPTLEPSSPATCRQATSSRPCSQR
jgi:hypothetical protein